MASTLGSAVEFLSDLGLFDVVLPFLLVFSVVFAILEKTEILGKGKKNINSIVALSVALITIAANGVVNTINAALPNVVLILVAILSFLMLLGLFWKEQEQEKFHVFGDQEGWYYGFLIAALIGVVLIFTNSLKTSSGETWLRYAWNWVTSSLGGDGLSTAIIFLVIIGVVVWYAQKSSGDGSGGTGG